MLEMTRIGKILSDDFPHARIALYNVCFGDGPEVKEATIDELVNEGILQRSKVGKISMAREYQKIVAEIGHYKDVNGDVNGGVNNGISALSGSLKAVYLIVKENPGIKTKNVSGIRHRAESTVSKQLAILRKMDYIEYRGADKNGGYYVK